MVGLVGYVYIRGLLPSSGADFDDHPRLAMIWPCLVILTEGHNMSAGCLPKSLLVRGRLSASHISAMNTPPTSHSIRRESLPGQPKPLPKRSLAEGRLTCRLPEYR